MSIRRNIIASFLAYYLTMNLALGADNPTQPGALRVAVYSDTAAELFWVRATDDGLVQGYEIRNNGSVVTVLDGTSYFSDTLQKGLLYAVTVTAIDDAGNRSEPASVSFVGGDRNQVGHDRPSQPANLRTEIYSSTAIELFWDRVAGAALTYEISINGSVVLTNRGTSFFTDELETGQRYAFTVVVIDASGNRSTPASIVVETAGSPSNIPATPSNVRFMVYSQTAGELFWDRAPAEGNVVSTEIRRDGVVTGMAEGNSFFDDTRDPNAHYVYGLTAIDKLGRHSITAELTESPTMPIINRDNHIDIVADALATYFGDNYNTLLVNSLDLILSRFLNDVFSEDPEFPITHACSNGGTAYFESSPFDILFSDCQIDDAVYNGKYGIQVGNSNWVSSDGLTITTTSGTTLQFDGSITIAGKDFYATTEVNVHLTSPLVTSSLAGVNTEFSFAHRSRCCSSSGNFLAGFDGSFDMLTPATNKQLVSVSTLDNFIYAEPIDTHTDNWNYRAGVLQVIATDNSELIMDADTSDDNTVKIQLNNSSGTEEFLQPWSLWQDVLRRSP